MKNILFLSFLAALFLYPLQEAHASEGGVNVSKFIFGVVNFCLFAYLVYRFGLKKLTAFFACRGEKVGNDAMEAHREISEASRCFESSKQKLENISGEIDIICKEAEKRGAKIKGEMVDVSRQRAETIKREGILLAERESEKARAFLKKTLMDMSIGLAQDKIGKKLDRKLHDKLIDGCIKQLETM